eukprot:10046565-Prorocentrum_lima.AAC.1
MWSFVNVGDVSPDFADDMKACQVELSACFGRHIFPRSGLGANHTDGRYKAHAWLHQHRLETNSWRDTRDLLCCYYSCAID